MKRLLILMLLVSLLLPVNSVDTQATVSSTTTESQYLWRANLNQIDIQHAKIFPRVQLTGSGSLSNLGLANMVWTIQIEAGLIPAYALYDQGSLTDFSTINQVYDSIEYFSITDKMIIIGVEGNSTDIFLIQNDGEILGRTIAGATSDHQLFVNPSGEFFVYANNTTFNQSYYYIQDGFRIVGLETNERVIAAGLGGAIIEQIGGDLVFFSGSFSNQTLPVNISRDLEIGRVFFDPVVYDLGNDYIFFPTKNIIVPFPVNASEFYYFGLQTSIISDGNKMYEYSIDGFWEQIAEFENAPMDYAIVDIGLYLGPVIKSGLGLVMSGLDDDNDGVPDTMEDYFGSFSTTSDSDNDGLSDKSEIFYGTDPVRSDADLDYDGDGLSNHDEIINDLDPLNPDSDYGGALDGWELKYGYNASSSSDDDNDDDGDGIPNSIESRFGSNPRKVDTDDDGMPDNWEIEHGLDPTVDNANEDPDDDGIINIEEYRLDTDPLIKNPRPLFEDLWLEILIIFGLTLPLAMFIWLKLPKLDETLPELSSRE